MTRLITVPRLGADVAWRDAARGLLAEGVPPDQVNWGEEGAAPGLFDEAASVPQVGDARVPRSFVKLAQTVVWHSAEDRFARLYDFLWRLRSAPHLMTDRADPGLARLRAMEKNVHRCQHKMKAFVRFREIGNRDQPRRSFAAWFEPTHHTVEPTAQFFARRFGDMDWRIITPDVSAFFEQGKLRFEVDHPRPDLPDDAHEDLWVTYFRNIFNPARLKVQAMQSEMPKKYWKNMPEAAAIPQLIAGAPARARAMAAAAPTLPPARAEKAQAMFAAHQSAWDGPIAALPAAIRDCTRCPLHRPATQAVPGQGPAGAALMIVGEQPGDQEDLTGLPFVGPAGQLFESLAKDAGLDRNAAYVTNAVKHFKFTPRGRRRIHQRPNADEINHCRWWLEAEIAQVKPRLILGLGATAALALTGCGERITQRRGTVETRADGTPVLLTLHPSHLLRLGADSGPARAAFTADLRRAAEMVAAAAAGS